jgi:hypothetical protein
LGGRPAGEKVEITIREKPSQPSGRIDKSLTGKWNGGDFRRGFPGKHFLGKCGQGEALG